jgi:cytochrome P450
MQPVHKRPAVPPGPKGLPLIGNILDMRERDTLKLWTAAWSDYGDAVHMRIGPIHLYFFAHPEACYDALVRQAKHQSKGMGYQGLRLLLGRGLITSDGDYWHNQRRLLQPLFTPGKVDAYFQTIAEGCDQGLARLARENSGNGEIELSAESMRLTMSVISRVIFGRDLTVDSLAIGQAFEHAFAFVADISLNPIRMPLAVPTRKNRAYREAQKQIDEFILDLIDHADEGTMSLIGPIRRQLAGNDAKGIRDEILTLFFAGFETTARTLTWAVHLLSRHPQWIGPIREEATAALSGDLADHRIIERMPLTLAVIHETLRLYPPAAFIARETNDAAEIGGYEVPKKSLVVLSPHLTHRHPDYWPDGDAFRPDRPELAAIQRLPKGAYLPFGLGPRVCLGRHMALIEATLGLAMFVERFDWTLRSEEDVGISFHGTSRPDRPIRLELRPRRPN